MKNTPTQLEPNVPVTRSHSMGFVILISCAAGLGGLLYGYDTAVISGSHRFSERFIQPESVYGGTCHFKHYDWRSCGRRDIRIFK